MVASWFLISSHFNCNYGCIWNNK